MINGLTMVPSDKKAFLDRVRSTMPDMHPTERLLAEFVISFPGELASYTASELASLAQVSTSTVSRFVRKLGYSNYDAARRQVRAEQRSGAALYMGSSQVSNLEEALRDHVEQATINLQETFLGITLSEIDSVAQSLNTARHVWVIGFRTSHSFASYLQCQIIQVLENVTVIPQPGQTLGEFVAAIHKEDAVIFIGLKRRISIAEELMTHLIKSKAPLLYISDDGVDARNDVTWHFRCPTAAPGPLFNHVSVMALTHLLATRVIELSGKKGRKRLLAIESVHDSLNEI